MIHTTRSKEDDDDDSNDQGGHSRSVVRGVAELLNGRVAAVGVALLAAASQKDVAKRVHGAVDAAG